MADVEPDAERGISRDLVRQRTNVQDLGTECYIIFYCELRGVCLIRLDLLHFF